MMRLILALILMYLRLRLSHAASNIRLVGGLSKREGRIEVFYNGTWGTVCDDNWDLVDANVVCRSLGLPNATSAPYAAPFGQGTGPIWIDDIKCVGYESSLLECPHKGFGAHDCGHKEDAGVACGYAPLKKITTTNLTGEITSPGYPNGMDRANYQWIFKPTIPRPLAAFYFEELDLSRSNRGESELIVKNTKNASVISIKNDKRKPKSGWIFKDPWMVGYQSMFTVKYKKGHDGSGFRLRYFIFSGLDDKDSCISHWNVKIVASVGALNVSWNAITNLLDYYYLVRFNATGKDVIQNFTMVTNSSTSVRITHLRTDTLYSIQVIGLDPARAIPMKYSCTKIIRTKKASWRLVGSRNPNEGVVQMDYNDKWGAICADNWDIKDASVACRTLGLPPATYSISDTTYYNVTIRQAWISNLRCQGDESSLVDCPHGGWDNLASWCRDSYVAGIMCGYPDVSKFELSSTFGVITSPGYPRYMEQAHYEWTLRPSVPQASVVVYFDDIDLTRHDVAISNLTMTDADGKKLLFVQRRKRPRFSYLLSKSPSKVVFYSSFTTGRSTKGFRMYYLVLDNPKVSLRGNWSTSARSTTPTSIHVRWSALPGNSMTLIAYLITHEAKTKPGVIFYSIAEVNSTLLVIDNLVGYAHYKVQVSAYLRENNGNMHLYKSKTIDVQTLEGVPVQAPPNVTIEYVGFRYVHVKWNPIPEEYAHGNLLGYNVYYQDFARTIRKTTITTARSHLYIVLANLLPAMKYHLQIAGYTAKGQGQMRYLSFLSQCGKVIEDKPSGRIPFPSISIRHWKVECEWTLKPLYKDPLIVVMVEKAKEQPWYYPCSQQNVDLINGHNRTVDKFCLRRQSVVLFSYGWAKVRLHSSGSLPAELDHTVSVSYLILKNGFEEVQMYQEWNIFVTNHNASTINVQWHSHPKIGGESVRLVAVCILTADSTEMSAGSANRSATLVQVGNLKAYTDYKVVMIAFLGELSSIDKKRHILKSQMVTIRTLKKDWNPRFPSEHDKQNSVRMMVKGLDVLQWNRLYDHTFKKTMALEVTKFCVTDQRCPKPIYPPFRKRRSNARNIIYTSEQVHLLPGYPVQTSLARDPENMIAAVTFYLKFPGESGMNSNHTLSQGILLDAVKASVGVISRAINKTILSVSAHRPTTVSPTMQTSNKAAVIGGSVVAVIIAIVLVAAVFIIVKRRHVSRQEDLAPVIELRHSEAEPEEPKLEEGPSPRGQENQQEGAHQEKVARDTA